MPIKHLFVTLILLFSLLIPSLAQAQRLERPIVRVIYFYPRDRAPQPNIDGKIDQLIKDVQEVYAQHMENHGFNRKSFLFETDAQGRAVIHHVKGRFNHAYYRNNWNEAWQESYEQFVGRNNSIDFTVLDVNLGGITAPGRGGGNGRSGTAYVTTEPGCFNIRCIAHELGHAFGLSHDYRVTGDWMSTLDIRDPTITSFCAAEWLNVIPAFNANSTPSNGDTTVEMLPPRLVASPNTFRLRFKVADPDGLHQVQLLTLDPLYTGRTAGRESPTLLDYKGIKGNPRITVEFVTTEVWTETKEVRLHTIDVNGNIKNQNFPIDITALLPPSKIVLIPDPDLAAAVRQKIGNSITTHTLLNLRDLDVRNRGIMDLTGLEHAHHLTYLDLAGEYIDGKGYVNSNTISDFTPLAALTLLRNLYLRDNSITDISVLAGLTQLIYLDLSYNSITDISVLAGLTQLRYLNLNVNSITDVSPLAGLEQLRVRDLWIPDYLLPGPSLYLKRNPLSYTSINTHIPAMRTKGVEMEFDNVAHPALLKISGDLQESIAGGVLPQPFVVEAMDAQGKLMKSVSVRFAITTGGGRLSATTATTDAAGRARTILTLSQKSGKHTVSVTVAGIQSSVIFTANATEPPMYWIEKNNGSLHRFIGSRVENLAPGVQNATSLVVDMADGKLYWTQQTSDTTGKIQRANLDGSNVRLVKALTSVPRGLALDAVNRKLYLTNGWGKVQRLNLDGSNFQSNLITGLDAPKNVVLDMMEGKLYWIEQISNTTGKIQRANLDGSNVQLVKELTSMPLGLALDTVNRKLYLTNAEDKIQRLNLDGAKFEPNFITGLDSPEGIAVDIAAGKLYWTEAGSIRCANLSGENAQEVATGLGMPTSIALSIVPVEPEIAAPARLTALPTTTGLLPNYPNPFNPETWIPYQLAAPADVRISIYAVDGKLIRTLDLGHRSVGIYESRSRAAYWDGRNTQGEPVASGVYFYTLSAGDFTATRRMFILK